MDSQQLTLEAARQARIIVAHAGARAPELADALTTIVRRAGGNVAMWEQVRMWVVQLAPRTE